METNTAKCPICRAQDVAQGGKFFMLREVCAFVRGETSLVTAEMLSTPLVSIVTPCDGSVCGACALERARLIVAAKAKAAACPAKSTRRKRATTARKPWDGSSHPWHHDEH